MHNRVPARYHTDGEPATMAKLLLTFVANATFAIEPQFDDAKCSAKSRHTSNIQCIGA